jgi:branched-subunit amino acid ABC-type transport system permease component
MEFLLVQALNGLQYGMLLFLLAAGLSLIFGMLDVINFAHGTFYMLGAYVGLTASALTGSFWPALVAAPLATAALGAAVEAGLLRRLPRGRGHLAQVLLTFGLALVGDELVKVLWGAEIRGLRPPAALAGSAVFLGVTFPTYRLFVIGLGAAVAVGLWFFVERSRLGAIVRAGVADRDMVSAMGIDIGRVFTGVFALGTGLAALAGVVAGPVLAAYPGMGTEILARTFIVVVVGGMGSLRGSAAASLLVGEAETFGQALLPRAAMALIYLIMVAVLLVRPAGLAGERDLAA